MHIGPFTPSSSSDILNSQQPIRHTRSRPTSDMQIGIPGEGGNSSFVFVESFEREAVLGIESRDASVTGKGNPFGLVTLCEPGEAGGTDTSANLWVGGGGGMEEAFFGGGGGSGKVGFVSDGLWSSSSSSGLLCGSGSAPFVEEPELLPYAGFDPVGDAADGIVADDFAADCADE